MEINITQKNPKCFECIKCNFLCRNKKDYTRHLSTRKHNMEIVGNKKTPINHICKKCDKKYMTLSGLWKHTKICNINALKELEEVHQSKNYKTNEANEICKHLLPFIKEMIIDIVPVLQPNHNHIETTNFNINMFLNEECKDAMNLTDFIDSIQFSIEDMLRIGNEGQTNGMSNILIDKLNALDIIKRPLHCSDAKKETIYVKDDDKWEKEERNNPKIKNALDSFTNKTIKAMPYLENNPDEYLKTISEVLKEPREDNKIISDMAKEITI